MCNNGITQFYLPPTHEPYLPSLPSWKASPPFGWYSLCLPTKGWPGWVDLSGWSHTEINVPHPKLNPEMVTHPSTNQARCRLTSLIKTNMLPRRQSTTVSWLDDEAYHDDDDADKDDNDDDLEYSDDHMRLLMITTTTTYIHTYI